MGFVDTHAHIYGEEFNDDFTEVIQRARTAGALKILLPSTDEASADEAVRLSDKYKGFIFPMLGLHPEDLPQDYREVLVRMEERLRKPNPFVAIGEVGLDYYWDASRKKEQTEAFITQIEWSLKYGLPLMIHGRNAQQEIVQCLSPFGKDNLSGVFHCFSGSAEDAAQLLAFPRFFLGIGGIVTFKKSVLSEVLKQVPLNRLVLETDSPYMAPVPNRGKRNEPSFIPIIAEKLAEVYGVPSDEILRITSENAVSLFKL